MAAALALCVAGTAIYINTNTAPVIKEYKLPDYFELTEQSTIGFNGAYFIELAYLSSVEDFLDYTYIDETYYSDADENGSENIDSTDTDDEASYENGEGIDYSGDDDAYDDADYNDYNEQEGVTDEENTDTDLTGDESEQTYDETTLPPEYENTDEDMFSVNEFDLLTKYNGTDETVVIPENVKEIAGHAFEGNEYVRRIVLRTTIDSLNPDAFIGCHNLCEIYYEGSFEEWDNVYKTPDVVLYGVEVVIAQEIDTTEDTTAETTAPIEESTEDTTVETTVPVEETTDNIEDTTQPTEATESKTVSLVSQLAGINGVKTKIPARMSYFPTSSVITVTNTDAAALYAEEALRLLNCDIISYYAFDISVFDADTSEKIHELGGDLKFDIGVPDVLSDCNNIKVYHINSGYPELLDSEIVTNSEGARMVEFSASSFSPFVFAAEADSTAATTAPETTETETSPETEEPAGSTDAAEEPSDEESAEDTTAADEDEPIIKVTFPASTSYIINPYHLDVKVDGDVTSNAAVISPEMKITSESNCKVAVYMSAVAQNVPDTVRLSETYLTKGETEKSLFLYVESADQNNAYKNYFDGSANQIVVAQH